MTRVLFVQPSLQPPGGAGGVAAWILQALVPEYRVTALTCQPVDVAAINRCYGTHLRACEFDALTVPGYVTAAIDRLPVPATLVRHSLLMRHARRVSDGFDVVIGAFNETDFGRPGIQYIHYPTYLRPRPRADHRWYHRPRAALEGYYALADAIAGVSIDRLRSNTTLVNSDWTGNRVRASLGIETRTVYPPVVAPAQGHAWADRAPAFLAVGRISPEKEWDRVVRILARVRRHVAELRLTIVGAPDRHTRACARALRRLAASLGSWIEIREDLSRDELRRLMAGCRYGIHGMREEHFGMAPAEMALAGLIVWVPRGGGQVEIVGGEPDLTYETDDEALDSITRTLCDTRRQERLREALAQRAPVFSASRFVNEVRDVVSTFPA